MPGVPGLIKRQLEIITLPNLTERHRVTQYHYTRWPDFGAPKSPKPLVDLVSIVREELFPGDVCLVHCSAGVGRTGTMIALNKIMEEIDNGAEEVDIFDTVLQLRSERVHMVQKPSQYTFLYACVDYYLSMKHNRGGNQNIDTYYVYNFDEDREAEFE